YHGGPVGIRTLAANTGEDVETIQSLYEPYLMQHGFLLMTPRGRMVTEKAYQQLGLQMPNK
ncbi:Holliday junction branch migration DNA helicase RuvB, partial [Lactobacillus sp. XV13L]|nr:Holliday junction branch migration DNA helicase RuvB [Lactobacillus sp. XV13L]